MQYQRTRLSGRVYYSHYEKRGDEEEMADE